ncbi:MULTISPECIES: hypothetical protein [Streptomyces]|uniref:Ricin B lectin domain-containing protein n=1 Tax=Streptomyces glycanivorans TaxID=3033808 RepID=A0ABY9JAG3_9ACTN|nr:MULTISPECIES: hypothetical protein [unclassified Streptomyces]WSQ78055.1 hypothetical protein OG725_13470 [Streptomyces sp. NBC_01213]TXS17612.1 hypothetical protein EAO68_07525 [Streptomyces sp. wa22]WLQ64673.1 hypothetical protein P8A20_14190 [Streptomyces sp. Alt3]WSQ85427.1 hypothetical protein OG722_14140 [Streptomyces sp. NBC_01212]WSR08481.1 hypothetical protein OG265_21875 [Streptomyces sp. NBC_01208]
MRRKLAKAAVVMAGIAAVAGGTVGTAQAADGAPVKVASFEQCVLWGKAMEDAGKIKGYHCDNMNDAQQWYLTPVH